MADTFRRSLLAAAMAGTMFSLAPVSASAQDSQELPARHRLDRRHLLPVGVAIATLVKVRLQNAEGINMSAISSAGSGENIRLIARRRGPVRDSPGPVRRLRGPGHRPRRGRRAAGEPALDRAALAERRALRAALEPRRDGHDRRHGERQGTGRFDGPAELRHDRLERGDHGQPRHAARGVRAGVHGLQPLGRRHAEQPDRGDVDAGRRAGGGRHPRLRRDGRRRHHCWASPTSRSSRRTARSRTCGSPTRSRPAPIHRRTRTSPRSRSRTSSP